MGLSSNVIWHQTDYQGLKGIIEKMAFQTSYSLETINDVNVAFPMISFCDIPLSDMREYLTQNESDKLTGKYGKYTIGMKRGWGNKKGLSPVWYRDRQAYTLKGLMTQMKKLIKKRNSYMLDEEESIIWQTMAYTKNVQGKLLKYGFSSYRFADEKELRYVPNLIDLRTASIKPFIGCNDYKDLKKQTRNIGMQSLLLSFSIEDIAYILMSNKKEKNRISNLLNKKDSHIVYLSYRQILQDIIGEAHSIRY